MNEGMYLVRKEGMEFYANSSTVAAFAAAGYEIYRLEAVPANEAAISAQSAMEDETPAGEGPEISAQSVEMQGPVYGERQSA